MKKFYLICTIVGFILPNYLVLVESVETGNILLYTHLLDTLNAAFANRISSIFVIDLLVTVAIFFAWSYFEAKKEGVNKLWIVWVFTMLFGLSGGLPLFLYMREKAKD